MDREKEIDVCGTWLSYNNGKNEYIFKPPIIPDMIKANLFFKNVIFHSTVIFRKLLNCGDIVKYNEKYKRAQDYELLERISKIGKVGNINEILVENKGHERSIFSKDRKGQIKASNKVRIKQLKILGLGGYQRRKRTPY